MEPLTRICLAWACNAFGAEHAFNLPLRTLRCAEEAVELAQAAGVSREKMFELVDIVYSRPKGMVHQEIGGVLMVITTICAIQGGDPSFYLTNELCRILKQPIEKFAKRNQDKIDLGLTT